MSRKVCPDWSNSAKVNKQDEFYSQLVDIESELQHYKSHFKDKIIFCNCDDPRVSNFFKYFVSKFEEFGIKKLITSCYVKPDMSLFNTKKHERGFYYEYTGGKVDFNSIVYYNDSGSFSSARSIELLKQSDIVITNPPFSLFRTYVSQLVKYDKKFLVIANINSITYKQVFQQIKANKIWLGINLGRGISGFIVPEHYELYGTEVRIDDFGNRIVSPNNCLWLTNLETSFRNENINLTKKYVGNESKYPKYENYDGINVDRTLDIPMDYAGDMGVPITFLHKYNPDQFEIIRFRKGDNGKDLSVNSLCPYFRILIRNKLLNVGLSVKTDITTFSNQV